MHSMCYIHIREKGPALIKGYDVNRPSPVHQHSRIMAPALTMVLIAALAGCSESSKPPVVPDPGPPEGRQVGPSSWLVPGGPLAWSAATNEILATGRVQAVPPSDVDALQAIDAATGSYRVVDEDAHRLGLSASGADVFFGMTFGPPDPAGHQVVRRSLVDGSRHTWTDGVRFVVSPRDSLLAVMTSPWYIGTDSLKVHRLADDVVVAALPVAVPLAFSPDGTRLLMRDSSPSTPNHRVLTIADLGIEALPLGLPAWNLPLEPLRWDERGVLVVHADGPDTTVVSIRNVTTGSDNVLVQVVGGLAGLTTAWSPDGRYATVFTSRPVPVSGQDYPGREISAWILDSITMDAWVAATTRDTKPGRYAQDYSGVFAPDGASFAWEAGGTLYVVPVARDD